MKMVSFVTLRYDKALGVRTRKAELTVSLRIEEYKWEGFLYELCFLHSLNLIDNR